MLMLASVPRCLGRWGLLLARSLADALLLSVQIAAHIGTLVFAVGVKVAYVARLVFLSRLGRPVH